MSGLLARWHNLSKRTQWVAAIGVILLALAGVGAFSSPETTSGTSPASTPNDPVTELVEVVDDPFDNETSGQENAREQAENYLNSSAFSRKGLIEQLKFEGYSTAEATYAVDNITVDWSEQAALQGAAYLRSSAFSRSGLMEQLLFEGYTRAQATYGVNQAY